MQWTNICEQNKNPGKASIQRYPSTTDHVHGHPRICAHLTMRCCVFTQRCGSVVRNVRSDLHFNRLYRPDEWDVQQSGGDRTQTDAVCVRRWICGSYRCSLMSHCSTSRLPTASNKGSKHICGKRNMLSPQIWLQLSDNILQRLLEYRGC